MRAWILGCFLAGSLVGTTAAWSAEPGDVNGDGKISVLDSILALRAAVRLVTLTPEQIEAADVDPYPGRGERERGDGRIIVGDAVRIMRRSVGLLPDLSASEILPIEGIYLWTKDSGGGAPKPEAMIGLDFGGHGVVTLVASQPGEQWTSEGKYAVSGNRIDLIVPELGWSVLDRPLVMQDGVLTLPFQVMSENAGTSSWRRAGTPNLPGQRALELFGDCIRQGLYGEEAQDRVFAMLRENYDPSFTVPQASGARPLQGSGVTNMTVEKDFRNLFLKYHDGNPYETVILRTFPNHKRSNDPIPLLLHPIGADPRSQCPFQPVYGEDNPAKLLAWVLVPNLNKTAFHYQGPVFKADGSLKTIDLKGTSKCSKDYGIDPEGHRKVLEWAGYEVKQAIDEEVTVRKVADALRDQPGVLLLSTHGTRTTNSVRYTLSRPPRDIPVFMTGIILYDYWRTYDKEKEKSVPFFRDAMRRRLDEQVATVAELFPDLPPPGTERRYEILSRYFVCTWMAFSAHTGQVWMSFTSDFLDLVRKQYRLDLSRSLVIASACDSATNSEGAMALRPKAYFGYTGTVYITAAARIEKYLVAAMARPTFNAREIYTRAFVVPGNKIRFYVEDQHLGWWTLAGINGILSLKAYGNEFDMVRPGDPDADLTLAPYRPYESVVTWLMFMLRWSEDLEKGRQALEGCYETYWKAKKSAGLANQYCQQGVIGGHFPTEDEVSQATLAVTGRSSYREKAANGRFTMNDGPVRPTFNPPPWDGSK